MAGASNDDDNGLIAGINVTPLVDVTLVLLIIFMVTAKIIVSQGMPMDLPKSRQRRSRCKLCSRWSSRQDGKTRVDSNAVANDEAIAPLAKDARAKNKELRAVIRADRKVEHGRVIHVLDLLKRSGIAKIAFAVSPVAEPTAIEAPGK
ncbi:MAG: biopolymer transporter ExbD [Polyangiaceae bacterium]